MYMMFPAGQGKAVKHSSILDRMTDEEKSGMVGVIDGTAGMLRVLEWDCYLDEQFHGIV